jgi:hypothetical protein
MNSLKTIATLAIAIGFGVSAHAITFDLEASIGGSNPVFPASSYGLLIADIGGGNFETLQNSALLAGATTLAPGSLIGSDILIFSTTSAPGTTLSLTDLGGGNRGFVLAFDTFTTTDFNVGWGTGDRLAILWFPDGTSSIGDEFNWYRSDVVGDGNLAFITPGNGDIATIINLSTNLPDGTTTDAQYLANNGTIAVPEPGTIFLLAFAPLLVKLLRSLRARRA